MITEVVIAIVFANLFGAAAWAPLLLEGLASSCEPTTIGDQSTGALDQAAGRQVLP